jgi:PAS domain S-box-containing protein
MTTPSFDQKNGSHPLNFYGDTKSISKIFNALIYLIFAGLVFFLIVVLFNKNYFSALIITASFPLLLIAVYLIRLRQFEWTAVFLALLFMSLITIVSTLGLGIHQVSIVAFPAVLIIAGLVIRKRMMTFLTIYSIFCAAWLVFGPLSGTYTPTLLVKSIPGDFFSVTIILILTAVMVRLLTESVFQSNIQLQKELKERRLAEYKYRTIFENAIDGIFQSTPDGRFVNVNPAMARMYGYDSAEDMVQSITDITSQLYIDSEVRASVRSRLENGEKVTGFETHEYRKDGSMLWTSMNAQTIHDADGNILYYEGTVEDITFRKEMETKRTEAETLYRSLVEQTSIVVYRISPDVSAASLYISPQIQTLLGYSAEEWLRDPVFWKKIVHPEDLPRVLADVELYMSKKDKSSIEYRIRNKAGDWRWVQDETVVVKDEAGRVEFVHGVFLDITERKEAENSLLQFRKLMDESNDAFFLIDPTTGKYIDFNKKAHEKLGYGREELSQLGVIDIAEHIASPEVWKERVILVREKGGLIFESNYLRKDGTKFPTEVSAQMLHYRGQTIMVANVRDITERKQAENALRESEARLQVFFNQSLDGFFFSMFDEPQEWENASDKEKTLRYLFANQRFTDVNNAMLEQYGISREKFLSLTSGDIFAHDPEQGLQLRRQLFDGGHLLVETHERRQDGASIWFEGEYVCLYDEQKRITGFFGIQRDITRRKQVELEREQLIDELAARNAETETLRESFASIVGTFEFAEIIEHILDQIGRVVPYDSSSVWSLEGNVQKLITSRNLPMEPNIQEMEIRVNEINSAVPIIRGDVPYILNHNVQAELLDFKDPPHNIINSWLAIPLKTRGKIIGLIALDGHRNNQFNERHAQLAVTFANQVAIALENARLFTEIQEELFTREKLIQELESKNAELERFTYTVSHDLKSPLVTINGFLGYLKGDAASGNADRVATDIQRIQDAVDKMHLLLRELLELSRIGRIANPPENIPFADLVRGALELVHGQLETRGVTVHIQPNLPAVQGDRQRLMEVLQNLIDNAAKYMGSQVSPKIEIGQYGEEAGQHIFFIKDNGIGISPQYHERIFGLFDKLDAKSEGTGVGLALVKRIIEVHGGRIWVESETGKGSTFYFTLPKK